MNTEEIIALDKEYVMQTYGRQPLALKEGKGAVVWDVEGRPYIDCVAGIAVNTWISGLSGLKSSAAGLGLAFAVYIVLYLLRAMGAGDVKLMAALGAIAGPDAWIRIFLLACILGGVIAIVLLLTKGRVATTLWNVGFILKELSQFRAPYMKREELDVHNPKAVTLPHGVSIALGVLVFVVLDLLRGRG